MLELKSLLKQVHRNRHIITCLPCAYHTVNNSNVKLRSSDEEGNPAAVGAGKDYRRLISETKRLLLMSPMYSLTLAEVVKHFVANSDPICSSVTELEHALASTQHSFLV